ncbi:MAG: AAA family ATPase [Candidatus Heimdallarchaeota archaeon]|nr:MAG: AAA family ATPase [Candidatus Heimdallarchaeota archaeon]
MLSDFLRLIKGFILIIGPTEAGKTSILRRLVTGEFHDPQPTLGFREENVAKVRVIEIGGQPSFRKYWRVALEQNPVRIIFVIDVTKENDYNEYLTFQETYPAFRSLSLLTINKVDLITTNPDYLSEIPEDHIYCSAKTGEGMLDILEAIASFKKMAEAEIPLSQQNEISSKESAANSNEKEDVDSIIKEFQGKF